MKKQNYKGNNLRLPLDPCVNWLWLNVWLKIGMRKMGFGSWGTGSITEQSGSYFYDKGFTGITLGHIALVNPKY